jgi:hypothetical protein
MGAEEISNDPDRAARIAELSPDKRALLARRLARATGLAGQTPVAPAPRPAQLPLSFAQQRLWFLEQWEGGGGALYNVAKGWWLSGDIDVERLRNAFAQLIVRHEALRTEFLSEQGQPLQRVVARVAVELPLIDLRALAEVSEEQIRARALELAQEQARLGFALERAPLLRLVLIRIAPSAHLLVLVMHHIVSDRWSMGVFYRELCALYAGSGAQLLALPVQYPDYALWQRAQLQGAALERELAYWRQQLKGLTALALPCDRPRPPVLSYRGARQALALSADLTRALKHLSQSERVTLYMVLLAAFQVLLARISGQDDVAVGSPIAGRSRREFEGLIGFFVNTLVLRIEMAGEPTFRELLAQVRDVALDAYAHQDLPFEKLVEELKPERDPSRSPLIQVMFVLQNAPGGELMLPGLEVSAQDLDTSTAKFDLTLELTERPDGLRGHLEYATDLFDPETIKHMAVQFQLLLEGFAADPTRRISQPQFLSTLHDERNIDEKHPETTRHAEDAVTNPSEQLSASRANIFPATPAQLGMWIECKLFPENPIYHSVRQFVFRGTLDTSRLIRSLQSIADRHNSLHTTFSERNGALFQVVGPCHTISCPVDDVTGLSPESKQGFFDKLIGRIGTATFDLQRGPLARFHLVQLKQEEHLLLVAMHHLVTDGPSWPVMLQELVQLYEGSELPSLPFQYGDFAVWQNKMLDTEQWKPHRTFWRTQVEGRLPLPGWPTDNAYHGFRGTQAKILQRTISRELLVDLESLRRQTETSLFCILLTADYFFFFRITG